MGTASSSNRLDGPEMACRTIEPAQQTAARIAGFTYLFTLATVVFAQFGIHDRLIVEGNAAETARNINKKDLVFLKDLLEAGRVVPVIDRRYPLSDAAEAFRYLEEGHAQGKVVVTVEHS